MGGDIHVDEALTGAAVKTYGGDITIEYAAQYADATTYGGDIHIREINGWAKAKTYGGDIEVRMVGDADSGDRHVELVSYGGDIELTVPEGLDMDIDIELAYTQNARDRYRIESDVEVNLSQTDEWDRAHGNRRKYLYGRGKTGSGKNRIVIKTVNGNVFFKTE